MDILELIKIAITVGIAALGWIVAHHFSSKRDKKLEDLISEIQLFGSPEQVRLVKKLTDDIVKGGDFDVDELVNSLRNDLRSESGLSAIDGNVRWLRQNNQK